MMTIPTTASPLSSSSPAPADVSWRRLAGTSIGVAGLVHWLPGLLWVALLAVFAALVVPPLIVALVAGSERSARALAILLVLLNFFLALVSTRSVAAPRGPDREGRHRSASP
jgi:uncharacterized membrane protein YqaE (UPF0057 family)